MSLSLHDRMHVLNVLAYMQTLDSHRAGLV